jgi:hypothetical protein
VQYWPRPTSVNKAVARGNLPADYLSSLRKKNFAAPFVANISSHARLPHPLEMGRSSYTTSHRSRHGTVEMKPEVYGATESSKRSLVERSGGERCVSSKPPLSIRSFPDRIASTSSVSRSRTIRRWTAATVSLQKRVGQSRHAERLSGLVGRLIKRQM